MTFKQYKIYRIIVVVILGMSISLSITLENYYLPIVLVIIGMTTMYYLRKQLKTIEVMADERDYKLAGDAARYTITTYGLIGVFGIFILMALSGGKEDFIYILSQYLAFSICFLFILNVVIFRYLSQKK
jgi:uncharacterized membrane protein